MELVNIEKMIGYKKVERQYGAYRAIYFPKGLSEKEKDICRSREEELLKEEFGRAIAEKATVIHKIKEWINPMDPLSAEVPWDEIVGIKLTIIEVEEAANAENNNTDPFVER